MLFEPRLRLADSDRQHVELHVLLNVGDQIQFQHGYDSLWRFGGCHVWKTAAAQTMSRQEVTHEIVSWWKFVGHCAGSYESDSRHWRYQVTQVHWKEVQHALLNIHAPQF